MATPPEPASLAEVEKQAEEKLKNDEKRAGVWEYINMATGDRQTYEESFSAYKSGRQSWDCDDSQFFRGYINRGVRGFRTRGRCLLGPDLPLSRQAEHTGYCEECRKIGFGALVVSIDSPVEVTRDRRKALKEYIHLEVRTPTPNLKYIGGKERAKNMSVGEIWGPGGPGRREPFCHADWEDLKLLKSETTLPIVLKGILSADSVRRAAEFGVSGIIVSAHGGRQLDGSPAPLDALPDVVNAVRGTNVEVYMDGGVRTGNDVVKALALGARAVFIGRPALHGVALNGEDGVYNVLKILEQELSISMALCADSARKAAEFGVSGIIVSAHGGRQLDGSPAPLDALPDVVNAVRGTNVEVYMDGGVRTGNDVVKALALGARAVFIGRPALHGVALNGEDGVYNVLKILEQELSISMALCGCSSLVEIDRTIVKHESEFHAKL